MYIPDLTNALFELASGATGYLGCTFTSPYTIFVNLYGTKANAFALIDADRLEIQLTGGEREAVRLDPIDTLKAELEEFADACTGRGIFRVTPSEAIHSVAVIEAIVAAAAQGRAVEIPSKTASRVRA